MVLELRLAEIDALIGQRQFQTAKDLLAQLRNGSITDPGIDSREMAIRETEHAYGVTPCEARIDSEPRALARHEDFLSAWNDVRDGFPRKAALPIPTDEDDAHGLLCPSCIFEEASFSTFELGEEQMIWNVVVEHIDSGVSVLPELIAGTMSDSCADNVEVIAQRKGDLVWVRAFADARDDFDPNDWVLGDEAQLGAPAPSPTVSPSYYAYAAGSSGYQGSGYQGTGYHYHYGCGGYDYYYNESCMITNSIERDVFIDLARGEVVLDIVRTGKPTSALGFVRLEQDGVRVDACGVTQTLPLSFTA
jgi:hypothetical protein